MRSRRLNIGILLPTKETNSEGRAERGNSKHDTNRQRRKGDGTVNGIHCRLYAENEYRSKQILCVVISFFGVRIFLKGENLLISMLLVEYRSLKRKSIHKNKKLAFWTYWMCIKTWILWKMWITVQKQVAALVGMKLRNFIPHRCTRDNILDNQ